MGQLDLSPTEAEHLRDILQWWLDGHEDAFEQANVTAPASVSDDGEELMQWIDLLDGMRSERADAEAMKARLELLILS